MRCILCVFCFCSGSITDITSGVVSSADNVCVGLLLFLSCIVLRIVLGIRMLLCLVRLQVLEVFCLVGVGSFLIFNLQSYS